MFTSKNGWQIAIAVEKKTTSRRLGTDFVSGGFKDFFGKIGEGFWVSAKVPDDVTQSSGLASLQREAIHQKLGSYPIVTPETKVSHLLILLWEGSVDTEASKLQNYIGKVILESEIQLGTLQYVVALCSICGQNCVDIKSLENHYFMHYGNLQKKARIELASKNIEELARELVVEPFRPFAYEEKQLRTLLEWKSELRRGGWTRRLGSNWKDKSRNKLRRFRRLFQTSNRLKFLEVYLIGTQ